jgi:hypothetical protein
MAPNDTAFHSPEPSARRDGAELLDALQKQVREAAVPALDRALGRVDDYLFDRSQAGDDSLGLTALRDLRRGRAQIVQRFEQRLLAGFRALRDPRAGERQREPQGLSLLSEEALEEQLANEQLAESLTRLHAPALELLGKRLAHLCGQQELAPTVNPAAPAFFAGALLAAMEGLALDAAIRIVVFKFFERELGTALAGAYERSNTLLAAAGVLPHLRPTARAEAAPPAPVVEPVPPSPAQDAEARPAGEGMAAADQAMFTSLLGLLQGWRTATGPALAPAAQAGAPVQTLSSGELLSILSLMQRDLPSQLSQLQRGTEVPLAHQLRQEVVQGARKLGVPGDNLQLDGLDEDAVDLVALLFDVLLDGPEYDSQVRRKIGRMLVPFVKVAVKDRRMFLFKEHPARRLLNTVAEACEGNHGDAPQERELLERVDQTIDRLVAEFNEDVAIFEALEQELRSYMAQHRRRAELAEKRAAEAQHGRERLEHARAQVQADLAHRRGARQLPRVIDEFLTRYAGHHLTQVILREGRTAPAYEDALSAIDAVLLAFDYAELRADPDELPALPQQRLEAILASSGCIGTAAHGAVHSIQDAILRLSRGESAAENQTRMPEQVFAPEPVRVTAEVPALQVVGGTDGLDFEAPVLERMRRLQVGNWLQLAAAEGRIEPAKVSWISPISGRLLLVNRRGIRVLVASPEELAAMEKLGKVLLRDGDTAFDGALHQVAGRLREAAARL